MRRGSKFILFIVLLTGLATLVLVAARTRFIADRWNLLAPLDLTLEPNLLTNAKLWMMEGDQAACVTALRKAAAVIHEMPLRTERPGCVRDGTVLISKLSEASIEPEEMRCDIALRLYLLERHGIQPLARRHFGTGVDRISHFGSYACRNMRGGNRLSEHATANAFDISGFSLADGRMVTLKKDWTSGSASARFLRDVRVRACLLFNMVLSPDYNADHAGHFHVDMGWFMGCH